MGSLQKKKILLGWVVSQSGTKKKEKSLTVKKNRLLCLLYDGTRKIINRGIM